MRRTWWLSLVLGVFAVLVPLACGGSEGLVKTLRWSDTFGGWSPDGRSIVFASDRSGEWDLYLITIGGRHLRRLTHDKAREEDPVFLGGGHFLFGVSPDGRCPGAADVEYLLSDHGRARRRLGGGVDAGNVYVSPNQRWIAYETSSSQSLYVMRADGTDRRRLVDSAGSVAWSPDSKMLAFDAAIDQGSQVYVTAIPRGRIVQLSHLPSISNSPLWSANGDEIAFSRAANHGSGPITNVVVRPNGSTPHSLPSSLAGADIEAWLPNGDWLLTDRTLLRRDGSVLRRIKIPGGAYLYPSPDGTRAAYEQEGGRIIPNACDPDVFPPAPAYQRIDLVNLRSGERHPITQP